MPTPFHDGKADLAYVHAAAASIAPVLEGRRSGGAGIDVAAGNDREHDGATGGAAARSSLSERRGASACDVHVAYCPERVLPGRVLIELVENDRVIGGITPECSARAEALYRIFCTGSLLKTDVRTAEMCKLTENSFRDVGIAFANELSVICEKLGINVWELIRLANHHPRVNILQPGPGVGGHCIAVDPWFIVAAAPEESRLIRTAREVNDGKPAHVLDKIKAAVDGVRAAGAKPKVGAARACLQTRRRRFSRESRRCRSPKRSRNGTIARCWSPSRMPSNCPESSQARSMSASSKMRAILIRDAHIVVMLVNHRLYNEIPRADLEGKAVIDTRGVWS